MNYELAKKLKDAGFPEAFYGWDDHDQELLQVTWDMYRSKYVPTLSELIKECGDKFESLNHHYGHIGASLGQPSIFWWAAKSYDMEESRVGETGPTPEEAVANLYLALNTK